MSELGQEVVAHARLQIGKPFEHHYKPVNLCGGGQITADACMQRGMGPDRYDCSGLLIASFSDVVGLAIQNWPRELRHTKQLEAYAIDGRGELGDIRLHFSANNRTHLGIAVSATTAIHASGVTQKVEEGEVTDKYGEFVAIRHISVEVLRRLVLAGE